MTGNKKRDIMLMLLLCVGTIVWAGFTQPTPPMERIDVKLLTAIHVNASSMAVTTPQGTGLLTVNGINAGQINANVVNATNQQSNGAVLANTISAASVTASTSQIRALAGDQISTRTLTASESINTDTISAKTIRFGELDLIDKSNAVRASVKMADNEQPEIVLWDKEGNARLILTIDSTNKTIVRLLDQQGKQLQ